MKMIKVHYILNGWMDVSIFHQQLKISKETMVVSCQFLRQMAFLMGLYVFNILTIFLPQGPIFSSKKKDNKKIEFIKKFKKMTRGKIIC